MLTEYRVYPLAGIILDAYNSAILQDECPMSICGLNISAAIRSNGCWTLTVSRGEKERCIQVYPEDGYSLCIDSIANLLDRVVEE